MHFKMSAICFNLDQSKILSSGNGLRHYLLPGQSQILMAWRFKSCENIVGKEEKTACSFFPRPFTMTVKFREI